MINLIFSIAYFLKIYENAYMKWPTISHKDTMIMGMGHVKERQVLSSLIYYFHLIIFVK